MHYFFKKTRVNIQELTFCLKMQQEQLLVCLNIENGLLVRCWSRNFIQIMTSDLGDFSNLTDLQIRY